MPTAPVLASIRERLRWSTELGALHDGPRRYLMMRPDVWMGAVALLPVAVQGQVLEALAVSTREYGADSLRAYAAQAGGDAQALMATTAQAAADLGWGRWSLEREGDVLHLNVSGSPFAAGWPRAPRPAQPVCAPIRGMLEALAGIVLGGAHATTVESECAACGAAACRFIARRAAPLNFARSI